MTGIWNIENSKNQKSNSNIQPVSVISPEDRLNIFRERLPFILEHCELSVKMKGEKRGVLEMRRHLSSYVKGFDGAKELRMKVLTLENYKEVREMLVSV